MRTAGNGSIQAKEELRFARSARAAAERVGRPTGRVPGRRLREPSRRPRGPPPGVRASRGQSLSVAARISPRAPLKILRRRGRWVAYTKSADGVTTVLAQMGLNEAVLEYEARAVLGEAKANANRVTNFDAANAGRTATAAASQQKALQAMDPEHLSPALK